MKTLMSKFLMISLAMGLGPRGFALAANQADTPALSPSLSTQPEPPYSFLMKDLYLQAHNELQSIEMDLREKMYSKAKFRAADLFDRIELKAKFVNVIPSIPVENGIITNYELSTPYSQLDNNKKDEVAMTLENYQNGAFMNMLNLAKRVKLQYIKASFYQLRAERKTLYKRDISALIEAAVQIHNIAIKIKSPEMKYGYLLFDAEFANSVRDADFNREILDFVMDNQKYFHVDENAFEELLIRDMNDRRLKNNSGMRSVVAPVVDATPVNAQGKADTVFRCFKILESVFNHDDNLTYAYRANSAAQCQVMQACLERGKDVGLRYDERASLCYREVPTTQYN